MRAKIITKLKLWKRKWIDYSIEDEYKIYRMKKTPLRIRYKYTNYFHRLCRKFPVAGNRIVFDNYMGRGYGCNGKYVLEYILEEEPELADKLDIIWIVKDAERCAGQFPPKVRLVEYGTREAFIAYATAGIWIKNFQMVYYLNKGLLKRPGQTYIQMWHGSLGIKKIEGNCDYLNKNKAWRALAERNARYTDYWISNSAFESQVYRDAFWGAGTILEYGHPRNDIFFGNKAADGKDKVRREYNLSNEKIVLYVPTFRDENGSQVSGIDSAGLLESLEKRFGGEWVYMIRKHPRMFTEPENTGMEHIKNIASERVIDVSEYSDIQELLAAADVVITDYSSAIFDFLLSGKPGFLLAEDYGVYEDIRGLYYPLEETPFPLARSQKELWENIKTFDPEQYRKNCKLFLNGKGSVEDGCAAARVAALIKTILEEEA